MRDDRSEPGGSAEWDWRHFHRVMSRSFPFFQEDGQAESFLQPPFPVGEWVRETLDRAFRGAAMTGKPRSAHLSRCELFETHRHLIARVHLPAGVHGDEVRTLVSRYRLRLLWPPDGRRDVPLQKPVSPKRSRARLKNGILEVVMPKIEESFYEL